VVSVYITEAHPSDEWVIYGDSYAQGETACIPQPRTLAQRGKAAARFANRFDYPTDSLLIDSINNTANKAYLAEPERLYVVKDNRIVYVGGFGPFYYNPHDAEDFIADSVKQAA